MALLFGLEPVEEARARAAERFRRMAEAVEEERRRENLIKGARLLQAQFARQAERERTHPTRPKPAPRPEGLAGTVQDIFRMAGRVAGGPEMEEAFLPAPVGLGPQLPRPVSGVRPEPSFAAGLREEDRETMRERIAMGLRASYGREPTPGEVEFAMSQVGQERFAPAEAALGGLERFATRFMDPTAAAGLQLAESPLGAVLPGVPELKTVTRGAEQIGIPEAYMPTPRARTFAEAYEAGMVNPIAAALGSEEEQEKVQAVLEEAGLPRALAARVVFDPTWALPGVGLTKVDDVLRLIRTGARLTGKARTAAVQNPTLRNFVTALRSEAGGPRVPKGVPERPPIRVEEPSLKKAVEQAWKPRAEGFSRLRPQEQDWTGNALERLTGAPDTPIPITTKRNLPTLRQFDEQLDSAVRFRDQAREQLKWTRGAVRDGAIGPERVAQAEKTLAQSQKQLKNARDASRAAQIRVTREDVVSRVHEVGGDDATANIIGKAFDDSVALVPKAESLLTAPAWRQWLARLSGTVTGTPPGAVGQLGHMRAVLREALGRHSEEGIYPIFKRVTKLLDSELDNITYTGPKKWADDAMGDHKVKNIVQHPDWFTGASSELRNTLGEAQVVMRSRLEIARQMGYPIEALDAMYLEQLWEIPRTPLSVGVPRIPGRVSVARTKLFDDYLEGIRQGFTPREMTVEELMQHSTGLLDDAVADAWMRQEVLRRFGTKVQRPITTGQRAFGHPLYRGWNGPTDVANWVDQLYNPTGYGFRGLQNVAASMKNTAFGLMDIAVGGIQFPLTVAHGGLQAGVATLNRSLQALGLPYMHLYLQDPAIVSRVTQIAQDGVHIGIGPSSVRLGGGTVLKYIPVVGKYIDAPLTKVIDWLTQVQFGHALTSMRMRLHEGNLMALKMAGKDITDPAVRKMSAAWANAGTGASRGALTPGRRGAETVLLTSFQMTRANLAVYAQLLKSLGPKATRMERLRAALVLTNLAAYTYGIQYLVNSVFGDGPQEWRPGRPEWATIRVKGQTVPILPQRSLLRGIDKSIKIIEAYAKDEPGVELQDLLKVWSQVAVGKGSPAVGAPLALAGFGFEPETGRFQMGTLSGKGRLLGLPPTPPLAEQIAFQERDVVSLGFGAAGFNPYETPAGTLLRERWKEDTGEDFNPEVDSITAREDPSLAPLMQRVHEQGLEWGAAGAIMRETNLQDRAQQEQDAGLPELARDYLGGNKNVMAELMRRYREHKGDMHQRISRAMLEVDYEPETPEGKALEAWATLDRYNEKYIDPVTKETDWDLYRADQDELFEKIRQLDARLAAALETRTKAIDEDFEMVEPILEKALEVRDSFFDIPKYMGLSGSHETQVEKSEQIDEVKDSIQAEANRIAAATGDKEVDVQRLWYERLMSLPLWMRQWVQRYVLRPRGGRVRVPIIDDPMNPERLRFRERHEELIFWFPDIFGVSRELAVTGAISEEAIAAAAR